MSPTEGGSLKSTGMTHTLQGETEAPFLMNAFTNLSTNDFLGRRWGRKSVEAWGVGSSLYLNPWRLVGSHGVWCSAPELRIGPIHCTKYVKPSMWEPRETRHHSNTYVLPVEGKQPSIWERNVAIYKDLQCLQLMPRSAFQLTLVPLGCGGKG